MKPILMIVHDFPPMGGGPVLRALKFAKYLPEFGWQPKILTLREEYYRSDRLDPDLLNELPAETPIYRTRCLKRRPSTKTQLREGLSRTNPSAARWFATFRKRLYRYFFVYQDEGFLWWPYAIPALRKILSSEPIDAILTTSPPHNVHLLGILAKRLSGKPCIADFRDGWTDDNLFRSKFAPRNAVDRRLERWVIEQADHIISTTGQIDRWFADRHGSKYTNKSTVIFNGFDAVDFSPNRSETLEQPLSVVHVGTAGDRRTIGPFLQAVRDVTQRKADQLEVEFVGTVHRKERDLVENTPRVTLTPYVPHKIAVQKMQGADLLLLVNSTMSRHALTGKLFEYIAAQRPVLALTPPGYLSDFIQAEHLGYVVPPDDASAIRDILLNLCAKYEKQGRLPYDPAPNILQRFNRRHLTGQLADVLNIVTETKPYG